MGIAITSGIIESLDAAKRSLSNGFPKWEVHTPGTLTPTTSTPDPTVPSRFIACVSRESTAERLVKVFANLDELGSKVQVLASRNVEAARQADVVLLW
jgi:pyrroline-5-carboxylate reductase